jgi:exopolyphosphatase/guanosine-5'-triphosphate,3'-diphosphate pyrophosphatase
MRLGVLDVGSNTVHLLVVDARAGAPPVALRSHKTSLHLAELLQPDGSLGARGTAALVTAVCEARRAAEEEDVDDLIAIATSAVRDATDSEQVLASVRDEADVDLVVLDGEDEARLTFLAVRRWFGWSAGQLLCIDIGGGSLEIAMGDAEEPVLARSLPLGAGRLTRQWLPTDPPRPGAVDRLSAFVRESLTEVAPSVLSLGPADQAVATSKTLRSLARLDGAAPYSDGALAPRRLTRSGLTRIVEQIALMSTAQRAQLPGVSLRRAQQLLAGAVVAHETMLALGLDELTVCPWAVREGVILRRLDWLAAG